MEPLCPRVIGFAPGLGEPRVSGKRAWAHDLGGSPATDLVRPGPGHHGRPVLVPGDPDLRQRRARGRVLAMPRIDFCRLVRDSDVRRPSRGSSPRSRRSSRRRAPRTSRPPRRRERGRGPRLERARAGRRRLRRLRRGRDPPARRRAGGRDGGRLRPRAGAAGADRSRLSAAGEGPRHRGLGARSATRSPRRAASRTS